MRLKIEIEQEDDGRWIAELPELTGVRTYGKNREEAITHVEAMALRAMADRLENAEAVPAVVEAFLVAA